MTTNSLETFVVLKLFKPTTNRMWIDRFTTDIDGKIVFVYVVIKLVVDCSKPPTFYMLKFKLSLKVEYRLCDFNSIRDCVQVFSWVSVSLEKVCERLYNMGKEIRN